MGELVGKSPKAVGTAGNQGRNTPLGDILNQPFSIFRCFLLEAGEQQGDTATPINAHTLISYPRLTEKGAKGTAKILKEEESTSEKDTDHC
jgi:hypothetical protein